MFKNTPTNKISIWLSIILPLFSLIFMATIFGNGQIEHVNIGVVDKDNSAESRKVISLVSTSPTFNLLQKHHFTNEAEARDAMRKMDIYGYLVIPDKYESDLYSGNEPTLNYYYHYAVLAVGGEVNRAFTTVLSNYKAMFIKESAYKGGLDAMQIQSVIMPAMPQTSPIGNSNLNFTTYISYPFFFVFFQIIILTIVVYTIGNELQKGKNTSKRKILKSLNPLIVIYLCESLIANFIFFEILNVPCATPPTLITISSMLFILATVAFAMIIIIGIPRLSLAMSVASLVGALGATLCGVTFPIDGMFTIFRVFSYLFPVRYFTEIQHNLMYNYIGLEHTWLFFCALLTFVLIALLMLGRLDIILKRVSAKPQKPVPVIYTITLLMLGGTFGYGLLYNLLYDPNIITKIPMAVVDKSNTDMSRKYISYINATQGIDVSYSAVGFHEAKELMKTHKAKGIVYIPPDFDKKVLTGDGGVIMFYETTTAFLYYLTMQASSIAAVQQLNNEYRADILTTLPLTALVSLSRSPSVNLKGIALYNQNNGYGSFLLPIVMTLILFQIMLLTIGNFLGSRTETLRKNLNSGSSSFTHSPVLSLFKDIMPFVLGFWVISFTLLGLYPTLFQLPTLGNPALILFGSFIFLLATGLMAGACSFIFRDRERVMLYVSFFSVGLIFISGMSYPLHQIPWFWSRVFYYIFPSSPFIKFFIKTNSMGASYNLVLNELLILVAQATVYFSIAVFVYRRRKITLIKDLSL